MKLEEMYKTESATIDYIISDLSLNAINDRDAYFNICVSQRIQKLNNIYNDKVDRILSFIIMTFRYDDLPLKSIGRIVHSISKVVNVLSKGFLSFIEK